MQKFCKVLHGGKIVPMDGALKIPVSFWELDFWKDPPRNAAELAASPHTPSRPVALQVAQKSHRLRRPRKSAPPTVYKTGTAMNRRENPRTGLFLSACLPASRTCACISPEMAKAASGILPNCFIRRHPLPSNPRVLANERKGPAMTAKCRVLIL